MSLRDTLTLSPYQKWKRHGQLPTKLMCAANLNENASACDVHQLTASVMHILSVMSCAHGLSPHRLHLLVAVLSAFLQITASDTIGSTMSETRRDLSLLLFPKACTAQWRGTPFFLGDVPTCRVVLVSDLREVLNRTVHLAASFEAVAVSGIKPRLPGSKVLLRAWVDGRAEPTNFSLSNTSAAATLGPLGPGEPWRGWLNTVDRLELSFDIIEDFDLSQILYPRSDDNSYWKVVVHLDPSSSRTSLFLGLRMILLSTAPDAQVPVVKVGFFSILALLNILSLLLAGRSLVLALYRLMHLTDRFEFAGRLHESPPRSPVTLPAAERMPSLPTLGARLGGGGLGHPSAVAADTSAGAAAEAGESAAGAATHIQRPTALRPPTTGTVDPLLAAGGAAAVGSASATSSHSSSPIAGGSSGGGGGGGGAGGEHAAAHPRQLRERSLSRRLSERLLVSSAPEPIVDDAAFLANLHMEYPFLNSKRVVGGASGDVVENTIREARAWLKQPVTARPRPASHTVPLLRPRTHACPPCTLPVHPAHALFFSLDACAHTSPLHPAPPCFAHEQPRASISPSLSLSTWRRSASPDR